MCWLVLALSCELSEFLHPRSPGCGVVHLRLLGVALDAGTGILSSGSKPRRSSPASPLPDSTGCWVRHRGALGDETSLQLPARGSAALVCCP